MKSKIFLVLTTCMTLAISTEIFSSEDTSTYYEFEDIKFDNSIDIEEIKQIPIEVLQTMKNSEGTIKSLAKHDIEFENATSKSKLMSTNDFSMYVWAEDIEENSYDTTGIDRWRFNAQGTWHTNPFYEFTDSIALSWSDDFTLDAHSCTIDGSDSRTSTSTIGAERGIAYDVDLQLGSDDKVILLTADVYKFIDNPNTNIGNISADYGHVQIKPSTVSVEFNEDNTISMSTSFGTKLKKSLPSHTSFTY